MSVTCYSGFLHQENWLPQCSWNIVESGIEYHYPNPKPIKGMYVYGSSNMTCSIHHDISF
jgi:hypothetical protein